LTTELAVRRLATDDIPAAVEIIRGLPDYFTDDVPAQIERDAQQHGGWVVTTPKAVVGVAVVERKAARAAEILWIAVDAGSRNLGYGTRLLRTVLDRLATEGVSVVEAKTLDASADYAPYEATRAFWERNGFVLVDTIDPLPGWQPGNPAAIYVGALSVTVAGRAEE
jgi:GNAT superfamily N-acetyltransferase